MSKIIFWTFTENIAQFSEIDKLWCYLSKGNEILMPLFPRILSSLCENT